MRSFHWSLVAVVAGSLAAGLVLPPAWINLHLLFGTLTLVLVAARIVWGFLGGDYARFTSFVRGPRALIAHLRMTRHGPERRYLGHNPLGGAMIVALLATLILLGVSGVIGLGGALKAGPLAFLTPFLVGEAALELHAILAYGLIGLIAGHVAGVMLESHRPREDLVASMIDGRKEPRPGDIEAPRKTAHAALAVGILAALVVSAAGLALVLGSKPGLGTPREPLAADYAKECGACHVAYHPSLLPAAAWSSTVDGLAKHFGENAKLSPELTRGIRDYLVANAAEKFDTLPAHRLRQMDPAEPLRITATPFWRQTHADIPTDAFKTKAVGGTGNCNACHRDAASGAFYPAAIGIPQGAPK